MKFTKNIKNSFLNNLFSYIFVFINIYIYITLFNNYTR